MDCLSRVCALFRGARKNAIVASAYLGANTLERILDSMPQTVQVSVFTRWGTEDIVSGATDWRAWDVAMARSARLYACPRLHAKIYIADENALVGSANATASGLGVGDRGNLELLVPVKANQVDVARVLDLVAKESTEAVPIGFDAAYEDPIGDDIAIWLPEIDPDSFVEIVQGRRPHTPQSRKMCAALRVLERQEDDTLLRKAVRETTLFRIVGHEFDSRPTPMTVDNLRDLLVDKVDAGFDRVSTDRLAPLVHWLGRYGTNAHAVTAPGDAVPTLYPGGRLASYKLGA